MHDRYITVWASLYVCVTNKKRYMLNKGLAHVLRSLQLRRSGELSA
jgi:hypothetical protein